MNRPISEEEFDRVYSHALGLGFEHLFVQFPETSLEHNAPISPFVPDFQQNEPFMQLA
jgi:hypothetical protein